MRSPSREATSSRIIFWACCNRLGDTSFASMLREISSPINTSEPSCGGGVRRTAARGFTIASTSNARAAAKRPFLSQNLFSEKPSNSLSASAGEPSLRKVRLRQRQYTTSRIACSSRAQRRWRSTGFSSCILVIGYWLLVIRTGKG